MGKPTMTVTKRMRIAAARYRAAREFGTHSDVAYATRALAKSVADSIARAAPNDADVIAAHAKARTSIEKARARFAEWRRRYMPGAPEGGANGSREGA